MDTIYFKLDVSKRKNILLLLESLEKMKVDPKNVDFSSLDYEDGEKVKKEIAEYIGPLPADSELRVAYQALLDDDSKWPSVEQVAAADVALGSSVSSMERFIAV